MAQIKKISDILNESSNITMGYTISDKLKKKLIKIKNPIAKKLLSHSDEGDKTLTINANCDFVYDGKIINIKKFVDKLFDDVDSDDVHALIIELEKCNEKEVYHLEDEEEYIRLNKNELEFKKEIQFIIDKYVSDDILKESQIINVLGIITNEMIKYEEE